MTDIESIKSIAMTLRAQGSPGLHSNGRVIYLCNRIEELKAENARLRQADEKSAQFCREMICRCADGLHALNSSTDIKGRMLNVAKGCLDYYGGYHDSEEVEIFHHGIQTVVNALSAFVENNPNDLQVRMLEVSGLQRTEGAKKE